MNDNDVNTSSPLQDLPKQEETKGQSLWLAALIYGLMLVVWGLVTTYLISAMGVVVFLAALRGWVKKLRRDPDAHEQ